MPETLPRKIIENAESAVVFAQHVRNHHRRRTNRTSPQREADIAMALTRLREAMKPLRTEIGRFPYGPQTDEAENNREAIRQASGTIQIERRKLWKMRRRKKENLTV